MHADYECIHAYIRKTRVQGKNIRAYIRTHTCRSYMNAYMRTHVQVIHGCIHAYTHVQVQEQVQRLSEQLTTLTQEVSLRQHIQHPGCMLYTACVCIYIYIYIYIHEHTKTQIFASKRESMLALQEERTAQMELRSLNKKLEMDNVRLEQHVSHLKQEISALRTQKRAQGTACLLCDSAQDENRRLKQLLASVQQENAQLQQVTCEDCTVLRKDNAWLRGLVERFAAEACALDAANSGQSTACEACVGLQKVSLGMQKLLMEAKTAAHSTSSGVHQQEPGSVLGNNSLCLRQAAPKLEQESAKSLCGDSRAGSESVQLDAARSEDEMPSRLLQKCDGPGSMCSANMYPQQAARSLREQEQQSCGHPDGNRAHANVCSDDLCAQCAGMQHKQSLLQQDLNRLKEAICALNSDVELAEKACHECANFRRRLTDIVQVVCTLHAGAASVATVCARCVELKQENAKLQEYMSLLRHDQSAAQACDCACVRCADIEEENASLREQLFEVQEKLLKLSEHTFASRHTDKTVKEESAGLRELLVQLQHQLTQLDGQVRSPQKAMRDDTCQTQAEHGAQSASVSAAGADGRLDDDETTAVVASGSDQVTGGSDQVGHVGDDGGMDGMDDGDEFVDADDDLPFMHEDSIKPGVFCGRVCAYGDVERVGVCVW
jgi:hypothetical protein